MENNKSHIDLLLWIIIIYCSGYYYSITNVGSLYTLIVLAFGIVYTIYRYRISSKFRLKDFKWLLIFIAAVILSELISGFLYSFTEIKSILIFILAFLIAKSIAWETFKRDYVRVMIVIAILAIIGQIIILSPYVNSFPLTTNYNGEVYINGWFFSTIKYQYSGLSTRMQGVFWEPGLLATYMYFAIVFLDETMFIKRRWYLPTLGLFSVCIILSRSGAGLLLLPIAFIIRLFRKQQGNHSKYNGILFVILIIMFGIFAFSPVDIDAFLEKYLYNKLFDIGNISTGTRLGAALVDLHVFADNFLFGVGSSRYAGVLSTYSSALSSRIIGTSGTSTLTTYLAAYGILGFAFIYNWIRGIMTYERRNGFLFRFSFAIGILMILFKEPHGNLLFMNCILMYMLTDNTNIKESNDAY